MFHVDTDIYFFRNPVPYLEGIVNNQLDLVTQKFSNLCRDIYFQLNVPSHQPEMAEKIIESNVLLHAIYKNSSMLNFKYML